MDFLLNQLKEQTKLFQNSSTYKQETILNEIKTLLETAPFKVKGRLFEHYLAFLYKGNGYLATVVGGRGDGGADIIIRHPKALDRTFLIVQAKNHQKPLNFDETRLELLKFETESSKKYDCKNYALVSINGFVEACNSLKKTNMRMDNWFYVTSLIKNFNLEQVDNKQKKPHIELFAHNQLAYQELTEILKNENRVAVVQATGTGKSFIILQLLLDYYNKPKIVIAPSKYIINNFKEKHEWSIHKTTFLTYQKINRMKKVDLLNLKVDLIIFDELHRIGAKQWEKSCSFLAKINPYAKIIGFSATPIRYMDNKRDMVADFFHNQRTTELSLTRSIAEGILPMPIYISALYTMDDEILKYKNKIKNSVNDEDEKIELLSKLDAQRILWNESFGIDLILSKHLPKTNDNMKFIIFCETIEHLEKIYPDALKWFNNALPYKIINYYLIHSKRSGENQSLKKFSDNEKKNTIDLLFCVDKLNEGLHLKEITGVIFLRKTNSPIIYYQQMGRALMVRNESPIIFDLVNNFENILCNNFIKDLRGSLKQEQRYRQGLGLPYECPNVHVYEYLKDAKELFNSIEASLKTNWDKRYEELTIYYQMYGHSDVPQSYPENPLLGFWVSSQRQFYKKQTLSEERIKKLNSLNFSWSTVDQVPWEDRLSSLIAFKEREGHLKVPSSYEDDNNLGRWVINTRRSYKLNKLSKFKINSLNQIGFEWELRTNFDWEQMLNLLFEFQNLYGHPFVPQKYISKDGLPLGQWLVNQKSFYRNKELSNERMEALSNFIAIWENPYEWAWNVRFYELADYKKQHNHTNVPTEEVGQVFEFCSILRMPFGKWVKLQRSLYQKNELPQEKIKKLNSLKFEWDFDPKWEFMRQELIAYGKEVGTINFAKYEKDSPHYTLGNWCNNQRAAYRKGILSEYRIQKLEEIGFLWDLKGVERGDRISKIHASWLNNLEIFKTYYEESSFSLELLKKEDIKLYRWIFKQIRLFKEGDLDFRKIQLFKEIGFDLTEF